MLIWKTLHHVPIRIHQVQTNLHVNIQLKRQVYLRISSEMNHIQNRLQESRIFINAELGVTEYYPDPSTYFHEVSNFVRCSLVGAKP